MKREKPKEREMFENLDREAKDTSDLRPMTAEMRRRWDAAKRTGVSGSPSRGRPRKRPELKSHIVPISIDPKLLDEADRYAKDTGRTRSGLNAEILRLRLKA